MSYLANLRDYMCEEVHTERWKALVLALGPYVFGVLLGIYVGYDLWSRP